MLFSFLYLAVRALIGLLVRSGRGSGVKDVEELALRLDREIPRWGHRRIWGELAALRLQAWPTSVRGLLADARLDPAPRRLGPTWRAFLQAPAASIVACDFFTVETAFLRRYCV